MKPWPIAAAAAVTVLAVGFLLFGSGGDPGPRPDAPGAPTGGPIPEPSGDPRPITSPQGPGAEPIGKGDDHQRVPLSAGADAGSELPQGIRGAVVGPDGNPLPGIPAFLIESADNNPFAMWQSMQHGIPLLPAAQTRTDARGAFALGLRQATGKRYEVRLLGEVFADAQVGPVLIQAADWYDAGTIIMLPGSVVRGRVTMAGTALPVPQATVTLQSGNAFEDLTLASLPGRELGLRVAADHNGFFELRNAPRKGLWTLHAAAPGFARATRPQIELFPDRVTNLDFELLRGLTIQGRIRDAAGQPIPGARVQSMALQGEGGLVETFTDRSGTFEIVGLREGQQRLQIVARGYMSLSDMPPVAAGTQGLDLILEQTGTARIRVLDPDGRIVSRYLVGVRRWFPQNGGQIAAVPTVPDQSVRPEDLVDGTAAVGGLEGGTYAFQVIAEGWAKTLSAPFEIGGELSQPVVEVRLSKGTTLLGIVVDESGRPIVGAEIVTQADGTSEDNPFYRMLAGLTPDKITRATTRTDGAGRFRLERLSAADYQIRVSHGGYCDAMLRGLAFEPEGEQRLDPVVLTRGTELRGRVTVDGVAAGQVKVVIGPPMTTAASAAPQATLVRLEVVSTNDGSFAMPKRVPPGTYELKAAQQSGDAAGDLFRQLLQFKQTAVSITILPGQEFSEHLIHIVSQR